MEAVSQETRRALVLVLPPQHLLLEGFSSGLIALASYVSQQLPHVAVRLVDLSHGDDAELPKAVRAAVEGLPPSPVVGVTATTASYQSALRVLRAVRGVRADAVTILGGPHAKGQASVILESHPEVDLVCDGEGERSLVSLLERYPRLNTVPGIHYRRDGQVCTTSKAPRLTVPELDLLDVDHPQLSAASSPGKFDHVTYVSARGCPLACHFCAVGKDAIRAKSIGRIIDDLRYLVCEKGATRIAIEDNFFAHAPARTIALCDAIAYLRDELGQAFTWDCQTRVESMKRADVVEAMARAGCEAVYLGVESLEPAALRYLGKTPDPDRYLDSLFDDVVPRLLRSEMDTYINLQLGLPGEADTDDQPLRNQLARLGAMAMAHRREITVFPQLHVVYPGTKHFFDGLHKGRFPVDVFETFTAWEAREEPVLRWLGHEFAHGTGGVPEGILDAELLRHGRYEIRRDAVFAVQTRLSAMSGTKGIRVFKYGGYIVKAQAEQALGTDMLYSERRTA